MTTKPDVINEALVLLGQPPASGPSDTSAWVRRITARYNPTVRRLLEDHPWNFASKCEALAVLDETPVSRVYAYNKPSDCLRINMINDTGASDDQEIPDYDDEGGKILADMSPCYMFYVSSAWITLEGSWPQKFAFAVSCELANINAEVTTKDINKGINAERRADKALKKAKSWDASQKPFRRLPVGEWAAARIRGSRYRTNG